jgi:hypothetical protein
MGAATETVRDGWVLRTTAAPAVLGVVLILTLRAKALRRRLVDHGAELVA